MKKRLIWLIGIVITLIVVFQFSKMVFFQLGQAPFGQGTNQVSQQVMIHSFDKGGYNHLGGQRHTMVMEQQMVRGHQAHHGGVVFPFLLDLGMIIAGIALLKLAGKKALVKGIGAALLFVGLWALLPNWLAIVFLLVGGYYWYKTREKADVSIDFTNEYVSVPAQKLDFLDEWERAITKEEK